MVEYKQEDINTTHTMHALQNTVAVLLYIKIYLATNFTVIVENYTNQYM